MLKRVVIDDSLLKQLRRLRKSPYYKYKNIAEISKDVVILPKYARKETIIKHIKKSLEMR